MNDFNSSNCNGPFAVRCDGQIELPEDNPSHGMYWLDSGVRVGCCNLLQDAMTAAEHCVSTDMFGLRERFAAELIYIFDAQKRLVLSGSALHGQIQWCTPAMSDGEAQSLATEFQRLRTEAAFEHGWDNYSTAKSLRADADRIDARIIHPAWRAKVSGILQARSNRPAPCEDRNSIPLKRFDDLGANLTEAVMADAQLDANRFSLPQTLFRHANHNCWSHRESTNPFVQDHPEAHVTLLPRTYFMNTVDCDEEALVD